MHRFGTNFDKRLITLDILSVLAPKVGRKIVFENGKYWLERKKEKDT